MSIELDFAGPLDLSHKNEAKVLFSFLFGLGLLRYATSQRRYAVRPISLYMLLFGKRR